MRVLSFDQSTVVTGWAIFDDGAYVKSGTIDLSNNHDMANRLKHMIMMISGMITAIKPNLVVVEDVQNQMNNATFKTLAQLQGAIMHICFANEIRLSIVAPSTWRRKLGFQQGRKIRRSYLKMQAVEYAKQYCKKKITDDEADAICIGVSVYMKDATVDE